MKPRFSYHQMLPSREYGGAAEIAFRLLSDLEQRSPSESTLWLPGEGRAWQKATENGFSIRSYVQPDIVHDSRSRMMLANLRTALRLRSSRPGLLHMHSTELYGGLPWASAYSGLLSVVHVHLEQEEATVRWAFRHLPDLVITCADFLVDNIRRSLPAHTQDQLRITAVPNCIDVDSFAPGDRKAAKAELGASPNVPLILMLANLALHKGQATALRAVAQLREQGIEVQCWLAGIERDSNNGYETKLHQMVEDLGLKSCVKFLGFRNDAPKLLQAADYFLLPSTREGLPLSVLEAQAVGVPVLAAPTAGTPEVIQHEETGYLIPANDVDGYSNCLAALIRNPSLAAGVSERALTQVRVKHNVKAYCDQMWDIYQDLRCQQKSKATESIVAS